MAFTLIQNIYNKSIKNEVDEEAKHCYQEAIANSIKNEVDEEAIANYDANYARAFDDALFDRFVQGVEPQKPHYLEKNEEDKEPH